MLKPVVSQSLSQLAALSSHLLFLQTKVVAYALSAAFAGAAASVVLCPMEALRIRLVVAQPIQYTSSSSSSSSSATTPNVGVRSRKNNWLVTGCEILRTEGLSTLGTGMIPMLLKQVPYTITKNVSFDFITRYAYDALQWRGSMIGPWMKLAVPFTAAAIASILSCVTSQPGDMLLTLSTARSGDRRRTRDIIRDIVRSERGSAGFFVGMKTRFFHLGIIVTVQLLIYDYLKRLCGIAPTGSA